MRDSAHTTHHTNPAKKSALPLFLEDENIFQKSASMVAQEIAVEGGVLIFFSGLYGGLYGQNLPYKFKKSYGDF